MAIDSDDEILQDFLIEAGELVEEMGGQLVELEKHPEDMDLLNSVFRNFHTVKGGAGFLALDSLVAICHRAEDIFNLLRQGDRVVTTDLMDVVLRSYDAVTEMLNQVKQGIDPSPADPELLQALEKFSSVESVTEPEPTDVGGDTAAALFDGIVNDSAASDEMSENEFEAILDQLANNKPSSEAKKSTPVVSGPDKSDLMTDDEFDKLLDNIHGPVPKKTEDVTASNVEKTKSEAQESTSKTAVIVPSSVPAEKVAAKPSSPPGSAPKSETTVRVDTQRLDDIMNLVGELVLVRNRLSTLRESMNEDVIQAVSNLDLVTADLQNSVMKTRMQPIKKVFGRFPRVVRDLARSMNKQVTLELYGEDTDLDKNLVEALSDPLVHLVRNAVDHGVEEPQTRLKAGKTENGTIKLSAEQEGDHILLTIDDDGAGMDAQFLRNKVVEKGLMDQEAATRLDDSGAYNLIFMPGFSTKTEVSDISGRGVGMDVVKTRITQLNGTIDIDSTVGKGSRIKIKVPLTLAIMPTLMVKLSNQIFALPLANVIEIFDNETARTNTVDGQQVVIVREKAVPLVFLRKWLVQGAAYEEPPTEGYVVVVSYGSLHVGFVVDQLIGQEEVVIKPLGSSLQGTPGVAGATITGDGRIALILDMPGLMARYG